MMDITQDLRHYIESEVIPRYAGFDAGHREDHARSVIGNALALAEHYDVDPDMVYAAAAFHDTGLKYGRENHELNSGKIIREDPCLPRWFTREQIETIAQAAEDHRASSKHAPRSIYGRIIAEADRLIDGSIIIRRAIQYGLANYPGLDKEGHYRRLLEHMAEKYAEGGYLKLWIPESPNAARLAAFQKMLKDPILTREAFEKEWASIGSNNNTEKHE